MSTKILGIVASVLVTGLVAAGLFVAGSPNTARNIRTDQETEGRLSELHYRLTSYETSHGRFPKSLAELDRENDLRPGLRGDGETPIEYRLISDHEYEVCAFFHTSSDDPRRSGYYGPGDENFSHGEGRTCFRRKSRSPRLLNPETRFRVKPIPSPVPLGPGSTERKSAPVGPVPID